MQVKLLCGPIFKDLCEKITSYAYLVIKCSYLVVNFLQCVNKVARGLEILSKKHTYIFGNKNNDESSKINKMK